MAAVSFVGGEDTVLRNLGLLENKFAMAVVKAGHEIGHILANYAKTHHKWGNPYSKGYKPTGHTDQSTSGDVAEITTEYVLVALSAGMSYDKFLELSRSGRWAWLWPAVIACEADIKKSLQLNLEAAMVL